MSVLTILTLGAFARRAPLEQRQQPVALSQEWLKRCHQLVSNASQQDLTLVPLAEELSLVVNSSRKQAK
jgi:hypothetical protein